MEMHARWRLTNIMAEHTSDKMSVLLGVGRWYGSVVRSSSEVIIVLFLLGKEMVQSMVFIVEDSLKQGVIIQLAELTRLTKCWKVSGQELRPL